MGLEIKGTEDLIKLSRALKQLGEKDAQRALTKGITKSLKPLKQEVKAHAAKALPRRGGLAKRVARTRLAHSTRKTGQRAGVRIEAKPSHTTLRDPERADKGRIKHPVFGMAASRAPWELQDVTKGWFSKPLEASAPDVRAELSNVMDDVAGDVLRKL